MCSVDRKVNVLLTQTCSVSRPVIIASHQDFEHVAFCAHQGLSILQATTTKRACAPKNSNFCLLFRTAFLGIPHVESSLPGSFNASFFFLFFLCTFALKAQSHISTCYSATWIRWTNNVGTIQCLALWLFMLAHSYIYIDSHFALKFCATQHGHAHSFPQKENTRSL